MLAVCPGDGRADAVIECEKQEEVKDREREEIPGENPCLQDSLTPSSPHTIQNMASMLSGDLRILGCSFVKRYHYHTCKGQDLEGYHNIP